jgi:hypothetical protein
VKVYEWVFCQFFEREAIQELSFWSFIVFLLQVRYVKILGGKEGQLYSPSTLCATMKKQVLNKNGLWKSRNRNEVLPLGR